MRVWDSIDAEFLRHARDSRALDRTQLARMATVSMAQLRMLEEGGDSAFYSPAIKLATGKRVLAKMGLSLPEREVPEPQAEVDAQALTAVGVEAGAAAAEAAHAPLGTPAMPQAAPAEPRRAAKGAVAAAVVGVAALATGVMVWGVGAPGSSAPQREALAAAPSPSVHPMAMSALAGADARATQPVNQAVPIRNADGSALTTASAAAQAAGASRPGETNDTNARNPKNTVNATGAEVVAAALPATAAPAVLAAARSEPAPRSACAWTAQPAVVDATPRGKPDTYVHLVAERDAEVCVMDGQQRVARVQLKAGEQRSVHGAGPWHLSGDQLDRVNVFFRGSRVRAPEPGAPSHWLLVSAVASPLQP
jgi:hypothetical protein